MVLAPADSLHGAACKLLARQALLVQAQVAGTIAGRDPEALHDLRVAARRARSVLRLLQGALPAGEVGYWVGELRWLGGFSGVARDLDVFIERVSAHLDEIKVQAGVRRALLAPLRHDRQRARTALIAALQSERFAALIASLARLGGEPCAPGRDGSDPGSVLALAPGLMRRELRRLRRWRRRRADLLSVEDLHAIRIAGKRARYALEFFADLLGGSIREHLTWFVKLQDCLGAHQDAVVARERLAALGGRLQGSDADEAKNTVQLLMHKERQVMSERRREFAALGPRLFRLARRISLELKRGPTDPAAGDEAR